MDAEAYPKSQLNTANRYRQRASYDKTTVHKIINTCPVVHVSFIPRRLPSDDPSLDLWPATLPMLACTGSYGSHEDCIYVHGHVSSRLMKLPTTPPSPEDINGADDDRSSGTPVTIAATNLLGLVLALTPFNHSCNYASAVIFGRAMPVVDLEEKLYAMEIITNNVVANRWGNSRTPPTKAELTSTTVLRVEIESASAKQREGGPGNDKKDEKDESVIGKVWQGVIPAYMCFGEPVPALANQVEETPAYLQEWVRVTNATNRALAETAAKSEYAKK